MTDGGDWMTFGHWIAMVLGMIAAGYGGLRGWERLQQRWMAREYPERPERRE